MTEYFLRRILVCFIFAAAFSTDVAVYADDVDKEEAAKKLVKATVTDRDGNAIDGATIVELDWSAGKQDRTARTSKSNADGEFEFPITVKSPGDETVSNYVVIYKKGYCLGALNLNVLPARARLWPMKPIALKVVDQENKPVKGARVSLGQVHFDEEFLEAAIPKVLDEVTSATTRDDGWAILRSARPRFVESVVVDAGKHGAQSFAYSFEESKFTVLQMWKTRPAKIKVLSDGEPAAGWQIAATAGDPFGGGNDMVTMKNPINGNALPSGIRLEATVGEDGVVKVEHALDVRTMYFIGVKPDKQIGGTASIVVSGDEMQELKFTPGSFPGQFQEGHEYELKVIDQQTNQPIEGVSVAFSSNSRPPRQSNATSDANGQFTVRLPVGELYLSITKAPTGYSRQLSPEMGSIKIDGNAKQAMPEIRLSKGQVVSGAIKEVDLAIRRARWMNVQWSTDDENGSVYGSFDADGTFDVTIPIGATVDTYNICAVGGGNDTLVVKSKDPLVLVSSTEE